jgi:two-component system cell cycle sensor histidine kinase/response regulator CckA
MTRHSKASPKTILIVEDSAPLLRFVRIILEEAGFTVLAASSASEATRLAEPSQNIDLLLSDVMMPGISGPDLATKLKQSRPEMNVILMSGFVGGELLVLNHGWHFIQKPFVANELVARVNAVLYGGMRDQGTDRFDTRK